MLLVQRFAHGSGSGGGLLKQPCCPSVKTMLPFTEGQFNARHTSVSTAQSPVAWPP